MTKRLTTNEQFVLVARDNEKPTPCICHDHERLQRGDSAQEVLRRLGYAFCDVPACNCGSWHKLNLEESDD